MGLLQDPQRSIEQITYYLDHQCEETFPGAFEIAAGNLCRQTFEQILFILCFYSRMPKDRYLRKDRTLKTAGTLIRELDKKDPITGRRYWESARRRGPRIRKFARYPRVLKSWRDKLNEPSHFSVKFRNVDAAWLRTFVQRVSSWFDDKDKFLVLAAINELFSKTPIEATLGNDPDNIPGVSCKRIVTPTDLELDETGQLRLSHGKGIPIRILDSLEIPRGPWPKAIVMVQHASGLRLGLQYVTKSGVPVNLTSFETILQSFSATSGQRASLTKRLRKLGFEISYGSRKEEA